MNIGIYGIGNFGYALIKHLDKNNSGRFTLYIFDRNKKVLKSLKQFRKHPFLFASEKISNNIITCSSQEELLEESDTIILSVNSEAIRSVVSQIKRRLKYPITIVNTAKALDVENGRPFSEVISGIMGKSLKAYAMLAGGTIASDLFKHNPLGVTLACKNNKELSRLKKLFESRELFVYPSNDVSGVEGASALKNVISILTGITRGLNFSFGSETHLISRSSTEAEEMIAKNFGCHKNTFKLSSQCWGNDLWMSALGETRNKKLGVRIGQLKSFKAAKEEFDANNINVEGLSTIRALENLKDINRYHIFFTLLKLSKNEITFKDFKEKIFLQNL